MPTSSPVEQHLVRLVEELQLAMPSKDKNKVYKLVLGPKMAISLEEEEEGFTLFAQIAPLPMQKREELFILLMKANFLGQGTGGSVIGLDKDEKFLTLSSTIPYEVDYKGFKETIEDFANFVDYWRTEVSKHSKAIMNAE